jgi:hypothetical protein
MLFAHESFYPSALATTEALTQEDMQPEVGGALAGDGRHGSTKTQPGAGNTKHGQFSGRTDQ